MPRSVDNLDAAICTAEIERDKIAAIVGEGKQRRSRMRAGQGHICSSLRGSACLVQYVTGPEKWWKDDRSNAASRNVILEKATTAIRPTTSAPKMAGQPEHSNSCSLKTTDSKMTPPRKLRQLTSPPKINQSRPVYPARVGPLLPSFDDWSDEEPEELHAPVKPWSRSA